MKKALSQAKILAIDRNKGRVTLAMKNGLISTGICLYDINALRVGMTVLVGKVSGTYVIINKVVSNPRYTSGSLTMLKPEFTRYVGLEYFNIESYSDHFGANELDTEMWGNTYPYLSYNTETGEYDIAIHTNEGDLLSPDALISNSRIWLKDPCVLQNGGFQKLWCKHTYPAGTDFSVEAQVYISDGVYSIEGTKPDDFVTQVIRTSTAYVRLTKVGKVWSIYWRSIISDPWTLLTSYTKDPSKEDWISYATVTLYGGYSGDVDIEIMEASTGGMMFPPYPVSAYVRVGLSGATLES
jgi:hypothetical protein